MFRIVVSLLFVLCMSLPGIAQEKQNVNSSQASSKWLEDSTRAVNSGVLLLAMQDSFTANFMGYEENMPMYTAPASTAEVNSFYGQNLWAAPYLVEGANQTVGMWEAANGKPDITNGNLLTAGINPSRILFTEAGASVSSHATNVALRIAGDNAGTSPHQGVAPKVQIKAWENTNVYAEVAANASTLLASNHSYAYVCGYTSPIAGANWYAETNVSTVEDYKFGRYSIFDQMLDSIAFANPVHSIVISAGNDRGNIRTGIITGFYTTNGINYVIDTVSPAPPQDGGIDGFDSMPMGAVGKNSIIVGACNVITGGYSSPADVVVYTGSNQGSTYGPTDDGRIKPDFVAASTFLTSGSSPQVTGTIALLQELNMRENGSYLWSSTIKALLAQTAFEADTVPGPDYKHGWGLINPAGAAELIVDSMGTSQIIEASLANGATDYYVVYSDGTSPLKVTLCWTDPEGTSITRTYGPADLDNPLSMLVNDLDVRITDLAGAVVSWPYILNPAIPAAAPNSGDNFRDNIEQIYNAAPVAGWYKIRVNHKGAMAAAQDYSLIISGQSSAYCANASTPQIIVNVVTDIYGSECSWSIADTATGIVYASGGPYNDVVPYNTALATHTDTICLPANLWFEFRIEDANGNGLFDGINTGTFDAYFICPLGISTISMGSGANTYGSTSNPPSYDSAVFYLACSAVCPSPTSLTAMASCTEADLFWVSDTSAISTAIEWGAFGFSPGTGTLVSNAISPLTINNLAPGTAYSYYVKDSCASGASNWTGPSTFTTDSIVLVSASSNLVFAGSVVTYDFTVTGNATSYFWSFGDGGQDTGATVSHDYSANGTYTVVVSAMNSCGTSFDTLIVVVQGIGLSEFGFGNINLYPNPNDGHFTVTGLAPFGTEATLEIVNLAGVTVYRDQIIANSAESFQLYLRGYPAGLYYLRIKSQLGIGTKPFIIR